MQEYSLTYLFIGAIACIFGAVPFGLVNLSVVNETVKSGVQKAMSIAWGAAFIEIIFAFIAIRAGSILDSHVAKSTLLKFFVVAVLLFTGIFFLVKKKGNRPSVEVSRSKGFFKGAILNLISVQVLLFWIIAAAFLTVRNFLPGSSWEIILFLSGVWIAKIMVLRGYALMAKIILSKFVVLEKNIDRIIGFMLILVGIMQSLRF